MLGAMFRITVCKDKESLANHGENADVKVNLISCTSHDALANKLYNAVNVGSIGDVELQEDDKGQPGAGIETAEL